LQHYFFKRIFLSRGKRCNCLFWGYRILPVSSKNQKNTQHLWHARDISFKNAYPESLCNIYRTKDL